MKPEYKLPFFRFLDGQFQLQELEQWIYRTPDLQDDLGEIVYFELIEFNFKDKYSERLLAELVLNKIVAEGEFLTWKITERLKGFIATPEEIIDRLNEFYALYSNAYNSRGEMAPGFKFLQNLGLNYLYWMDEGYLKTHYGNEWQAEYKIFKKELPFYHEQLKPVAKLILQALEDKTIEIFKQGDYVMTDTLRKKLESDTLFRIVHDSANKD